MYIFFPPSFPQKKQKNKKTTHSKNKNKISLKFVSNCSIIIIIRIRLFNCLPSNNSSASRSAQFGRLFCFIRTAMMVVTTVTTAWMILTTVIIATTTSNRVRLMINTSLSTYIKARHHRPKKPDGKVPPQYSSHYP